jgi:hypothetical protein
MTSTCSSRQAIGTDTRENRGLTDRSRIVRKTWGEMPKGQRRTHRARMIRVGVCLITILCAGGVFASEPSKGVGQQVRPRGFSVVSRSSDLGMDADFPQSVFLAGVPAPRSKEHDLWAPALDISQIQKLLGEMGTVRPPVMPMPSLEERWQKLLSDHLQRMGVVSPENQKRWVELLRQDEEKWRRFLEGIQRRLAQDGQEVPPLPPPSWSPSWVSPRPLLPPPLTTDSPFVRPPPDRLPGDVSPPPPRPLDPGQSKPHLQDPRTRSWESFRELWERYVGPLDNTPELRDLLLHMMEKGGMDWDLRDSSGRSLWEVLRERMPEPRDSQGGTARSEGHGGEAFAEEKTGWRWPRWQWPRWNLSLRRWRLGSEGGGALSGWSGGGWEWPALDRSNSVGLAILVALVILIAVLTLWLRRRWRVTSLLHDLTWGLRASPPVDPRQIRTAEDLVRAFEWWSLHFLGPAARHWTHATIAQALFQRAARPKEQTEELARLYALARYAPEAAQLPPEVWQQARHIFCQWAGVSPA